MKLKIALGFVLFMLLLVSVSFAADEELVEGIYLYSSNVVAYQDLSYGTCVSGNNLKTRVYCFDTEASLDLPAVDGGDGCYYSYVDLSKIPCSDLEIQSTYLDDGVSRRLTKRISLKKTLSNPRGILDKQDWDGGWDNSPDTAYAIWILSDYSPRYDKQIEEGLNWLKENRLEEEKCWPGRDGRCSIYNTATTLLYLKYAGFNQTEKIFQDGFKWLESQMNYIEGDDWSLTLNPSDDDNCTISFDKSKKTYEVIDGEELEIYFDPKYGMEINVSCDDISENVAFWDEEERYVNLNYDYDDRSRIYEIPDPCWGFTEKWDSCNRKTSLYASLMDDIDEKKLDLATDWLVEELRAASVIGRYLSTDEPVVDSSLMLYDLDISDDDLEDIEDWLIHAQNNDGSWGHNNSQEVKSTGYALLALNERDFSGKDEVLNDGFSWLSANYPAGGWDRFSDEAISFLLLKETAKSFLKVDSAPVLLESDSQELILTNPTGFDLDKLTYGLSSGIKSYLTVSGPSNIESLETGKATISKKNTRAGLYSGLLSINGNGSKVASIPVIIKEDPKLEITTMSEIFNFFSEIGLIKLKVVSNADFSCKVETNEDGLSLQEKFTADKSGVVELNAVLGTLESKIYTGNFKCSYDKSNFEIPFEFDVRYFDDEPIKLNKNRFKITKVGKNATLKVENNLDIPVSVDFSFPQESLYLTLGKRNVVIDPEESYELNIINLAVPVDNSTVITDATTLIVSAFDQKYLVDIELEVSPKKSGSIWTKLIVIVVIFLALLGIWYYLEKRPKGDGEKANKKTFQESITDFKKELRSVLPEKYHKYVPKSAAEIAAEKKAMKEEIQKSHLKDMVVVMKKLDKSEQEIQAKLSKEGLSETEVTEIIRQVNLDQKLQDSLSSEEEALKIVQSLDKNSSAKSNLKEQGFSDDSINEAFEELQNSLMKKEEELKKQMKDE